MNKDPSLAVVGSVDKNRDSIRNSFRIVGCPICPWRLHVWRDKSKLSLYDRGVVALTVFFFSGLATFSAVFVPFLTPSHFSFLPLFASSLLAFRTHHYTALFPSHIQLFKVSCPSSPPQPLGNANETQLSLLIHVKSTTQEVVGRTIQRLKG